MISILFYKSMKMLFYLIPSINGAIKYQTNK